MMHKTNIVNSKHCETNFIIILFDKFVFLPSPFCRMVSNFSLSLLYAKELKTCGKFINNHKVRYMLFIFFLRLYIRAIDDTS